MSAPTHPVEPVGELRVPESPIAPLHVLLFSSYYWPENSGNAPYVTGLAEHLASEGHPVRVVTGFAHYPEWRSGANGALAGASQGTE